MSAIQVAFQILIDIFYQSSIKEPSIFVLSYQNSSTLLAERFATCE